MADETRPTEGTAPAPVAKDERVLPAAPTTEPATKEADEAPSPKAEEATTTAPETKAEEPVALESKAIDTQAEAIKAEESKPEEPKAEAEEKPAIPAKDVAPTPATAATTTTSATPPTSPAATPPSKLDLLYQELPAIYKEAGYREMWGIELSEQPKTHVPTSIVITKFLRANTNDVAKAKKQLIEALKWRKQMEPLKLLRDSEFNKAKFGNLGYVTSYGAADRKEIITWNIYGAVKDKQATFGEVDEFMKWRTALMELSITQLELHKATAPIPLEGPDPYRMIQVHDYLNISFLRIDPAVKNASKIAVQTFSMAYPELLKEKYFVNVPVIMSWMFAAMKPFLPAETIKKFHPLGYGERLARELPDFGDKLPTAYGGNGGSLETTGMVVRCADVEEKKAEEKKAQEKKAEEKKTDN